MKSRLCNSLYNRELEFCETLESYCCLDVLQRHLRYSKHEPRPHDGSILCRPVLCHLARVRYFKEITD
jgi:hypothetical protein